MVLSAPSGCGKTTIVDRLLKRHPDWVRSVSITTRPPREGEVNGSDYFFVSLSEFEQMKAKKELLESAKVFDAYYGTPKVFVERHLKENKTVILTIDIQGAAEIKQVMANHFPALFVFVLPPSIKILRERLETRKTESPEQIEKRIQTAQDEIKEAGWYDLTVVNQNLDQTIAEIEKSIEAYQKRKES